MANSSNWMLDLMNSSINWQQSTNADQDAWAGINERMSNEINFMMSQEQSTLGHDQEQIQYCASKGWTDAENSWVYQYQQDKQTFTNSMTQENANIQTGQGTTTRLSQAEQNIITGLMGSVNSFSAAIASLVSNTYN